jgi:hypothetical protein
MNERDYSEAVYDWRRTGRQDAANVMDPNEIEDRLGKEPSAAAVKKWLLEETDPEIYLEMPGDVTEEQKKGLLDAWADGWSAYASHAMVGRPRPEDS